MQSSQERQQRAVEQMTAPNRQSQLRAYYSQVAKQFDNLLAAYGAETPADKRRYTLAYNGLRKLLKKGLHYIIP